MKNLYKYTVIIGFSVVFAFGSPFSAFATHSVAHIDERIVQIQAEIQELMKQIQALQTQIGTERTSMPTQQSVSTAQAKFLPNDSVIATSNLRARNSGSIAGVSLTTIPQGTRGVVIGGPVLANGYTWWQVSWLASNSGWSVENYLQKVEAQLSTNTQTQPPAMILYSRPAHAVLKVGPSGSSPTNHMDAVTIASGESVNLSWSLTNSAWSLPCTLSGGTSGAVSTIAGDKQAGPFTSSQTITLTCFLAGIPYSDSVAVNVTVSVLPTETTQPIPSASAPGFYKGPFQVNSATCGDTYTFTVSNYPSSQVWLVQEKLPLGSASSWVKSYDGLYSIPNIYTSRCNQDEGTYSNTVYSAMDGWKGSAIGNTMIFKVNAATPAPVVTPTVTVLSPNGGETYVAGKNLTIRYVSQNLDSQPLTVYLYSSTRGIVRAMSNLTVANSNNVAYITFDMERAGPDSAGQYKILLCSPEEKAGVCDYSDNFFTLTEALTSQPTFSFSSYNGTLIAGKDAWTYTLSNAQPRDTLSVDVYKDGNYVGRLHICTVPTVNSPIPYTSCSASATPTASDIGTWTENVLINGVQKGTVNFTVKEPPVVVSPTITTSSPTCSLSFSQLNIRPGDTVSWTVNSNPTGLSAYWYGTKNGNPDVSGSLAGITDFTQSYTYQTGNVGSYTRYLVLKDSYGNQVCTTNTINANVNITAAQNSSLNLANVIGAMMETLRNLSKELDLLK